MEAVKPRKKHKKKPALQSAQRDDEVKNVKDDIPSSRPKTPEGAAITAKSSEDAGSSTVASEGAEKHEIPSTSDLSENAVGSTTTEDLAISTSNNKEAANVPQTSTEQANVESSQSLNKDDVAESIGDVYGDEATKHDSTESVAEDRNETGTDSVELEHLGQDSTANEITAINQEASTTSSREDDRTSTQTPEVLHRTQESDVVENVEQLSPDRVVMDAAANTEDLSRVTSSERSVKERMEVSQMYPKLDSLTKESESSIGQKRLTLEAFSEDYLKMFYFNPLLEQMEGFVDHFIRMSKQEDHEFYQLVNTYFKGRNALAMAFKEYEVVVAECENKKDQLWITKDFTVAAQGKCQDQVNVTHNHAYQQVEMNPSIPGEIEDMLKTMQTALHETLALQKYTCQLARLHIDIYLHDMLRNSSLLSGVTSETLVTEQCPVDMSPDVQAELQKLRDCISVLFMFVRQPIQDKEFVTIMNGWIEQLVAVLLRVASLADLVFLLNHVMRCPPGFPSKIAHFIQFPVPQYRHHGYNSVDEQYYWDNPLVHHFVAMLAAVLRPVRDREGFLQKLYVGKQATMRSISWTLVDEDGESLEDEDPETSWVLIQESDLIAVFSQFQFDAIFKHLLKMDPNIPNDCLTESQYHVEHTTSRDIMRMLAFGSCVVYVMGNAFRTYEKVRYRGFVKRVGRTIRQVVQYVLDHWSDYRSWRVNICGDSEKSATDGFLSEDQLSIKRLQVEVDQFFLRAAHQIISAHRLGAWQFLADMPFNSVSSDTLWKLFWALHTDIDKLESVASIQREQSFRDDWREELQNRCHEFSDQLSRMTQSEAIFLLTTFANMATSRGDKEREFIEAVSLEVYEVSFIASQTRESCSKTGRHLLGTISGVHPFVISVLLEKVSTTVGTIGKACVYLFSGLSVHLWHPTYKNMDCIRSWLLKADLSSPENQLARYVISNLNWGHVGEPGESDQLFLHKCWHRAVAVTLVEVSALRFPNMPGGISHEAFKEDSGLLTQVALIATSSYSRMMQPSYEQQLYDWLWEVMLILRLHPADLPTPVMQFTQQLPNEDELQASGEAGPGFGSLVKALSNETLELCSEIALTSMSHGIKAGGPLACYAAIAMTTTGSSCDLFAGAGLDHLTVIMNEKCFDAVFRIVANVTPMSFSRPEKLTQEARFVSVIHRLSQLDNENVGYADKLLQMSTAGEYCKRLAGVIQSHVQKFQAPGTVGPVSVVEFWMQTLCSLPNWYRDVCVQFLLDNLIKIAVRVEGGLAAVQTQLMKAYQVVLRETGGQGVIASILSWVTSSGNAPPVLWDIKATPDYSYYAYSVLCNETHLEEESGFSLEMSKQLLRKPDATVDMALKKVVKSMKLTWHPQLSRLSIYRWASQAVVTDMNHPMLPLIWQRFFSLYLQRPVTQPGLAQRAGVGYRYFDNQTYLSMLKKMKHRLQATAEHHRNKSMETGADRDTLTDGDSDISKQFEHTRAFHEKLAGFYQTLALWLDEPRLHDPSLFLPSLPSPYDPTRLETLLKPEQCVPWTDLLYVKRIDWEVMESVRCWVRHALGPHKKPLDSQITGQWSDRNPETAASRIIRRMKIHPPSLPPPPVKATQPILPHVSDVTLMNRQKVLNIVYTQIQGMVTQARKFCGLVNHHISLDIEYVELLPKMYSNEMSQIVVQVPCRSKFFKDGYQCKGPATLTIKFLAKRANEVSIRKIAENRNEQEQVIQNFIQPCSSWLCEATAHVETIITSLVNKAKVTTERRTQEILNDIGTGMFYQISGTIDENVLKYPPTVQFFTLCIEILGKEFIMHNASQTEQLLSAILEHTSVTMLLVPYFSPNDNPDAFTVMYRRILDTGDGDLVFSLLSKFDIQQWLSSPGSNLTDRSRLTDAVFNALNSLGYEPADKQRLVLDMYLRHLSIVVKYNFPERYSDALRLLCEGSSKRTLCLDVWNTFLSCIGCVPSDGSEPPKPCTDVLGDEQVLETLDWLTKYFSGQRAELGGLVAGSLYTMWRPYIKQLSFILGFMCQQIVVRRAAVVFASHGEGLDRVLVELWSLIRSVFEPWLCSQESPIPGNLPVAPWNESEVPQASDMITLFTDTLGCLHSHLNAPHSGTSVMNMFWTYFVTSLAKEGIPDYVLRVYHSKFFLLPWHSFFPTLQNMQLMQELYSLCKSGFRFLGLVFPLLYWNQIVAAYCEGQTNESIGLLHASLFHLLVMFSNEKSVMEVQGSKMPALLDSAQSFAWHYLDGRSFDEVVSWQVEHCTAASVLQEKSSVWYALRLIRAAAGIVVSEDGSMQPTRPDTAGKRASYVRCVASLLCQCSSNTKLKTNSYSHAVVFVLKDIQSVAGSGVDPASTASEVCLMMSEALNLLNNCSPVGDVLSVILNVILQFIRDSSCTMLVLASIPAACRTLASIKFMVSVVEAAIESFFAKHSTPGLADAAADAAEDGGWGHVVHGVAVPDLAQDEFVQECIKQGALLTLYTNIIQKLSTCQSPPQEMAILTDMVTWCVRLKVRKEFECKLLLFWHKILQLALRQVHFSSAPLNALAKQLSFLISNLHTLGEDKESSGLLGAIGFGKKSPLSVKFRFISRALECFLLAQMPSNSLLRLDAKAPGYVREPKSTRQSAPGGRVISSTAEAEQALINLESLRTNKHYTNLTEHVMAVYSFIANPLHSLKDGPQFVADLVRKLFPGEKALLIVA